MDSYMKVVRTIESSHYEHLTNGSVINLINNFGNIYSKGMWYQDLISMYNRKLKKLETNNS